ncbi:hypothetical protein PPYR_13017 [Photinus pyralis]|uniref:Beta-glucuronidase n=1 Tax=Photinus pyralis TaxID=7054 RepID=A0A5N4A7T6_PHOPY|nr:beta-glucuronidase [Photinus pyralis]XP_031352563.1 beta-glucuronidase [Photinus pyralis]XP_031352564.1 beta-glucuronidase [Photinus pyralis]KAB0793397.1 hypothetical protein PPYR_13017 [Photinus pyralis]
MFTIALLIWTLIMGMDFAISPEGMLFPRESETREILRLDGIWNFAVSPMLDPLVGFRQYWYKNDLSKIDGLEVHLMPVPSSYNDITTRMDIRDHVGLVWYDRTVFVPESWAKEKRVVLRFSSVSYAAQVWVNGKLAMNHEMGHLPFQKDISPLLNFGGSNRITVACDNTLLQDTVPQGAVREANTDQGKKLVQSYTFDFFNYAGIHRPVVLYTTPLVYIDDITVRTDVSGTTGLVFYSIGYPLNNNVTCIVILLDKFGNKVAGADGFGEGALKVPDANLWWPYMMHSEPAYLYTLQVELRNIQGELLDIYRQPIGIRTISWTNTSLLLNNRPVYFHGFGRHEDADIRGKGLDLPTAIRDHNLIRWVHGNAYRTSHYPYADELMDLADQFGIMIIDECPSVDTDAFSYRLLEKHKDSLSELYRRDKNHPSVIMWSIANEPRTQTETAGQYFGEVAKHIKELDDTRPITIAIARGVNEDKSGFHLDIISFNRYNAWYQSPGRLDMIVGNIVDEATAWHKKYNKPVLISEYGADTMAGLHILPDYIWSEEYQVGVLSDHFKAFDKLRAKGWFIGEFVWNFADFKTAQTYTRVGGNKKGIFTRDRQPKAGAHHLRKRYSLLSAELYNISIPSDLYQYLALPVARDEL